MKEYMKNIVFGKKEDIIAEIGSGTYNRVVYFDVSKYPVSVDVKSIMKAFTIATIIDVKLHAVNVALDSIANSINALRNEIDSLGKERSRLTMRGLPATYKGIVDIDTRLEEIDKEWFKLEEKEQDLYIKHDSLKNVSFSGNLDYVRTQEGWTVNENRIVDAFIEGVGGLRKYAKFDNDMMKDYLVACDFFRRDPSPLNRKLRRDALSHLFGWYFPTAGKINATEVEFISDYIMSSIVIKSVNTGTKETPSIHLCMVDGGTVFTRKWFSVLNLKLSGVKIVPGNVMVKKLK